MDIKILIFVILVTLGVPSHSGASEKLGTVLKEHGLRMARGADCSVDTDLTRKGETQTFRSVSAECGPLRVELEIVRPVEAEVARRQGSARLASVEGLYEARQSPYPGEITRELSCAADLRPRLHEAKLNGEKTGFLIGGANGRFQFGVCDQQSVKHIGALVTLFEAKTRSLVEFRIFLPRSPGDPSALSAIVKGIQPL